MEQKQFRLVGCPKCRNVLWERPGVALYECGGCGAKLQGSMDQESDSSSNQPSLVNSVSKPTLKIRLLRCPKCRNVLPVPLGVSRYDCGGCGAKLQAKKPKKPAVDTPSQKPEDGNSGKQNMEQVSIDQLADGSSNQPSLVNSVSKPDLESDHNDLHSSTEDHDAAENVENSTIGSPSGGINECLFEFQHLRIQLEDIISITENFGPSKLIGRGGFGPVYKGELALQDGRTMVAFKRLDRRLGQGNTEFWKEIMMLSRYRHENLVSLLHFCNEGEERILVYEYISRGSLDRYLDDPNLSWTHRLHICIGAARAINYLHDPVGTQQRVLHRDIKSSNILLDENWRAKVSDFGLAKVSPANQQQTFLISNVVGTLGYCDPLYWEMGFLTKESDVYSFGVVLFEVLTGKLCCEYQNGELIRFLVHKWKRCCDEKRLKYIVSRNLYQNMDKDSLMTFSTIARRCVNEDRRDRPTMAEIISKLEVALAQEQEKDVVFDKVP